MQSRRYCLKIFLNYRSIIWFFWVNWLTPYIFNTQLVKLSKPPSLRSFISKHRSPVPELYILFFNILDQVFLIQKPSHCPGCTFRSQHKIVASQILKLVHFFLHNIRGNSQSSWKCLRVFQNILQKSFVSKLVFKDLTGRSIYWVLVKRKLFEHVLESFYFFHLLNNIFLSHLFIFY